MQKSWRELASANIVYGLFTLIVAVGFSDYSEFAVEETAVHRSPAFWWALYATCLLSGLLWVSAGWVSFLNSNVGFWTTILACFGNFVRIIGEQSARITEEETFRGLLLNRSSDILLGSLLTFGALFSLFQLVLMAMYIFKRSRSSVQAESI